MCGGRSRGQGRNRLRKITDEVIEEIENMTGFADNSSSPFGTVNPGIGRNVPCIHSIVNNDRTGPSLQQGFGLTNQRRKTAIETDHQQTVRFSESIQQFV